MTPHFEGTPEDYAREEVQVTVALNGQDFDSENSDAYVTFVGTGSDNVIWNLLVGALLVALLIVAFIALGLGYAEYSKNERKNVHNSLTPNTVVLRNSEG